MSSIDKQVACAADVPKTRATKNERANLGCIVFLRIQNLKDEIEWVCDVNLIWSYLILHRLCVSAADLSQIIIGLVFRAAIALTVGINAGVWLFYRQINAVVCQAHPINADDAVGRE